MSTNIPPIQWTTTGVVLPTDAEILTGAQADIDAAFGGGTNPALNTPQGQIASSESAIVSDKNSNIAYIANQVDPQYSEGRFQDAIGRIYFMTRKPAQSTVVICTIGGVPGAYVPAGSLALDTSENVYQLLGAVNIGTGGTVQGEFANVATGPIPCYAGTLTKIYKTVPGWDTITNAADGILGVDVESPQAFELRRQNSVAANSHGTTDAIFAAVYAVSGVLNAFVIDNPSGNTVNYGSTNYPLAPHSIYVAVVGGQAASIAQAIWQFKDAGCSYNTAAGNGTVQTVTVYDTRYTAPQPAYDVSFVVPGSTPVYFAVTLGSSANLPSNYATTIQNAIIAQFEGQNNNTPAGIASLILAGNYYGAVLAALPGVELVSIFVGLAASPTGYDVQMGIDQEPTLSAADITVTVL
ncbi:baseplate J/gp47 family protein [Patescibacteria group bacterium]|nr:baseplate J/gp47 family protein [Patescibacteria group bacterium]